MDVIEQRRTEGLVFKKYLEARRVLIADPNGTVRIGIHKILQDLGAQTQLIEMVKTFPEAMESIEKWKPHVIITEFNLGKSSGLELFPKAAITAQFRSEMLKEIICVLVDFWIIRRAAEVGLAQVAQNFIEVDSKNFPEKKAEFVSLLKSEKVGILINFKKYFDYKYLFKMYY